MTALAQFTQNDGRLTNNAILFEWDQNNKKEVEQGKTLFRQAKYFEKRKVVAIDGECEIEHFHPSLEGIKVMPSERTETQLAIRIHDETGDQRLIWDSRYPAEIEEAAEKFNEYLDKGWKAYAVRPDGQNGKRIFRFDANAEEIYFDEKKESLGMKLKNFIKDFGEVVMLPKTHPG